MNANSTPCFPQFIRKVAALGKRSPCAAATASPIDVEAQFKRFLPRGGPEFSADGIHRRSRKFPLAMVFWCFIWQVLKPRTPCREVVRQIQALGETQTLKYDESTSGYCQARIRLPEETLIKALKDSADAADRLGFGSVPGWNRPIKVVEGR